MPELNTWVHVLLIIAVYEITGWLLRTLSRGLKARRG